MNSELFIIVGCTVVGGVLGGLRGLRMISVGGYTSGSALRQLVLGLVVGLVLGLVINEFTEIKLW